MRRLDPTRAKEVVALLASPSNRRLRWAIGAAALLLVLALFAYGLPGPSATPSVPSSSAASTAVVPGSGAEVGLPTDPSGQTSALTSEPSLTSLAIDVGLKLLLTVALVYGSLYLLKRYVARGTKPTRLARVSVVETVRLGQHGALHLVRVGERQILVGATQSQITLLTELEPGEATESPTATAPVDSPFLEQLRALTGGKPTL